MLHSGVDAPGGRDARAPSGAQESLQGGIRLLTGHRGGASARRRKHVQRPATRHHSRGGARRRGAGVHVVGTVFNDQPAGTIPGLAPPRSRGTADARSFTRLQRHPTRQRFHRQSAAHHPRTGHPTHTARQRPVSPTPGHPRTEQPHPHGPPTPAPSIMRLAATKRTPVTVNLMIDPQPGGRPGAVRLGRKKRAAARPARRSCSSGPPGVPFAQFAGYRSARSPGGGQGILGSSWSRADEEPAMTSVQPGDLGVVAPRERREPGIVGATTPRSTRERAGARERVPGANSATAVAGA